MVLTIKSKRKIDSLRPAPDPDFNRGAWSMRQWAIGTN